MVVQLRPRAITVERGSRGFGLSLIYRGLDKYEEKDTGIFVARVVPGGQAARYGVREDDKVSVMSIKMIFCQFFFLYMMQVITIFYERNQGQKSQKNLTS